jgi:hypothetical protein
MAAGFAVKIGGADAAKRRHAVIVVAIAGEARRVGLEEALDLRRR